MPSQRGRIAVVTGTGGIGFEVARALACAGALVILAGRNPQRGLAAVRRIQLEDPGAQLSFRELDLASLASVRRFCQQMAERFTQVDLLINNAGVMTPPTRRETTDGFELQWGTNVLGHFALTAQLLPLLCEAPAPRVVTVSSIAARQGRLRFDDLQSLRHYQPMQAYSQSKLGCLMFALELQRRSEVLGWGLQSLAAHPGIARTELLPNGAGPWSGPALARRGLWFLFQPAAQGALPVLHAATAPAAQGGSYWGPAGWNELRGAPAPVPVPPLARLLPDAARLWDAAEQQTGVAFPLLPGHRTATERLALT